ncbi:MAG TPA: peptidoglycan DD-metalloendopeptidase family protein, partial [Brumimicrobium sp.]|nr:peptidoglycan DD-metalloendopeptidase family protein [Brumimicrobium sp.]
AIDFDSPNNVIDPVRAVKAGRVVFTGWGGGYGNLVRIRHTDGTQTYYAHNDFFHVTAPVEVQQGCKIADGGNTGNSFGDHIHFEWKDVGGAAFSDKRYPNFMECGCKVKPKICYRSTNTNGACSGTPCTPPVNDNCGSATTITSNGAQLSGTVKCATGSYGPNTCTGCNCASQDDMDVYYKFVAQASAHKVTLSGYSSNFDGVIELRTACAMNTAISCYDPSGTPAMVAKEFTGLTVGQTYYVRVYTWNYSSSPPSAPTFKIKVTHTIPCPKPGAISAISGNLEVCKNSTQTYSVPAVAHATTYTWTLPSGWTGSSTNRSINANVGSTGGEISVKASNSCGTTTVQTVQASVKKIPARPGTIAGKTELCQGGTQENYSISPVADATSFTWTLPSGWTGTSNSTLMTATTNGTGGQLSVRATNTCGSGPIRYLTTTSGSINNNVTLNNGVLRASSSGATYQWIDCTTQYPINGETGQSFTPTQNGNYAVIITKGICTDTSTCNQISTVGLSYVDQKINLIAYPNPAHDKLTISANGLSNEKHNITITNAQGQVVIKQDFKVNGGSLEEEFDMGKFPSGLYFMTIKSSSLNHVFKIEKI